jgi:hypothetical protein
LEIPLKYDRIILSCKAEQCNGNNGETGTAGFFDLFIILLYLLLRFFRLVSAR